MSSVNYSPINASIFFSNSEYLDRLVLRPLSHIHLNWELFWDDENARYRPEDESFADELNDIITKLNRINPPQNYHKYEDIIVRNYAEFLMEQSASQLNVFNLEGRWVKRFNHRFKEIEYDYAIEAGSVCDDYEFELLKAAAGRIRASIDKGQKHFDEMEEKHQFMLSSILTIVIYRRYPFISD